MATTKSRLACVLAALVCVLCAGPVRAAAATEDGRPPARIETPLDQSWREMIERHDLKSLHAASDLVGELYGDGEAANATLCSKRAAELSRSLKEVPVSFALWDVGYRCAVATGDAALADQRAQGMALLLRESLDGRPPGEDEAPIRVISQRDAFVLIRRLGQEVMYAYYDVFSQAPSMSLHVALWDPQSKQERWLSFDFTGPLAELSGEPALRYPASRYAIGVKLVNASAASGGGPVSAAAVRILQLRQKATGSALVEGYLAESRAGNYLGAYALGYMCLAAHLQDCGEQAVDALLPWAEQHVAQAQLFLARAYAGGYGVKPDRDAAWKLLVAADARLGHSRGLAWYAGNLLNARIPGLIDGDVWAELHRRAGKGDVMAQLAWIAHVLGTRPDSDLPPQELGWLTHAAQAGYRGAEFAYATVLAQQNRSDLARLWLSEAADTGLAGAELQLARAYQVGRNEPFDPQMARHWYERAAMHGSAPAMNYLGFWHRYYDTSADHLKVAQGWLQSGALVPDMDATVALASLYVDHGKELGVKPDLGMRILREMAATPKGAPARRQLADLLIDKAHPPGDFPQARQLLLSDAQKGDAASQRQLGRLLLDARNSKRDPVEGLRWLHKAADASDVVAMLDIASAHASGLAGRQDLPAAMQWWLKAADRKNSGAYNELAWRYCTSTDRSIRDPGQGMPYAHLLERQADLDLAQRDTIAACYAANGDFERAATLEQQLLDQLRSMAGANTQALARFADRVALYRRHQPYLEQEATVPSPLKR